jgi:hypothetical protein
MKAEIIITDDKGNTLRGEVELAPTSVRRQKVKKEKTAKSSVGTARADFGLPLRHFVKTYSGRMTGPKKFTLLLAYMANGKPGHQVKLNEIESNWNKMKGLLGGEFNRAHSNRAKDYGWVDSPKQGRYLLRPSWTDILRND